MNHYSRVYRIIYFVFFISFTNKIDLHLANQNIIFCFLDNGVEKNTNGNIAMNPRDLVSGNI
jgi:hypothetical protein